MSGIVQALLASGGTSVETDPSFANVLLLLNCPGSEGSTTLTDSSSYARTATRNGTPTITTTGLKTGGGAAVFDGTSDNWTFPDADELDLNLVNFTIEGSAYKDFSGQLRFLLSHRAVSVNDNGWYIYVTSGDKLHFTANNSGIGTINLESTSSISNGATFDWAVTRSSADGATRLFLNGSVEASTTGSVTPGPSNGLLYVGTSSNEDGTRDWKGKQAAIRLTANVARYTGTYTPRTSIFPTS